MLSGSPTGNRNAGGPGLDANRARALAYLRGASAGPPTATGADASLVAQITREDENAV